MERIHIDMLDIISQAAHFHKDDLEIILVLEGSLEVHKMQRSVTIQTGEMTFINRFVVHYLKGDHAKVLSVHLRLSEFKDVFDKIEYVEFLNMDELQTVDNPLKERLNAIVIELILKLYDQSLQTQERTCAEYDLMHLLFHSYQLISHVKSQEDYPAMEMQERYYGIVEYLMNHINEKIETEDILEHFYLNSVYFSQFMKKINGQGFKTFLSYRKLMRIMDYLVDDELSMYEIAEAVGIFNMKSFYALFHKYFDESPVQWKERIKLMTQQCYQIENEHVLQTFITKFHFDKHRDNTIYKVYNHLILMKNQNISLENIDIEVNPYKDMGTYIDEHYQVYKYLDVLIEEIHLLKAHFQLNYPIIYIKESYQKQLLIDTLHLQILQYGLSEVKNWRICFYVSQSSDLTFARTLKEELENQMGLRNIHIVLD